MTPWLAICGFFFDALLCGFAIEHKKYGLGVFAFLMSIHQLVFIFISK